MTTTTQTIPKSLIYEEFGGRVYYRKGYRKVLLGLKKEDEIMGSSIFQSLIIQAVVFYLKSTIPKKQYWVPTNEAGLHLYRNKNFANDISIIEKTKLANPSSDKYNDIPPKVIIEVDVKIDTKTENEDEGGTEADYILQKSHELLDFGVEVIVWVLTKSRQILVMRSHKNVEVYSWSDTLSLFEDYSFCLQQILEEEEILPARV
jgi:Uma2 family endonuclease